MQLRQLTAREWRAISSGLAAALRERDIEPLIANRAHPAARLAALWRGRAPIMAPGRTIWWPGAAADFADTPSMPVLQHELQHVLEFATGALTVWGYLTNPRNWSYDYSLEDPRAWTDLGAERRAMMAEDLWRAERGDRRDGPGDLAEQLRARIPWAGSA